MGYEIISYKITVGCRTQAQILARIAEIDALLDVLFTTALTSVGNGNIFQYKLDTGQTKTDVTYTSTSEVATAIKDYESIRTLYRNKLIPRMVRLVDSKTFRR
ncbi:MAG: hypothetical protein KAU20_04775 [Nanoarchaeota archaeon]|nr:hypothetical protein [Nanoarchaeota archaeon]